RADRGLGPARDTAARALAAHGARRQPSLMTEAALRAAGLRRAGRVEEPLAPYTTWRIGGPAAVLATPKDRDDVVLAVRWAREQGFPWRVLGNGSNLLVPDAGVRGLVLHLRKVLDEVTWDGPRVRAGAGV